MKGPIINGEQYDVVVLRVLTTDMHGRPDMFEAVHSEQTVRLDDGKRNVFITAFIKQRFMRGVAGGNA